MKSDRKSCDYTDEIRDISRRYERGDYLSRLMGFEPKEIITVERYEIDARSLLKIAEEQAELLKEETRRADDAESGLRTVIRLAGNAQKSEETRSLSSAFDLIMPQQTTAFIRFPIMENGEQTAWSAWECEKCGCKEMDNRYPYCHGCGRKIAARRDGVEK